MHMEFSEQEANEIDEYVNSNSRIAPIITTQNLSSINSCPDKQMYRARVQYLFQLEEYVIDEEGNVNKELLDILIDMVHDAILFASDNNLSYPKSIIFLTLYIVVLQQILIRPLYEPNEVYKIYERLLLAHSVERPPFSSAIFELPDITIIHNYFINTLFRNMKFILNCFTQRPLINFSVKDKVIIQVPTLPALSEMEIEQVITKKEEGKVEAMIKEELGIKDTVKPKEPTIQLSSGKHQANRSTTSITKGSIDNSHKQQEPTIELEEPNPEVPVDVLKASMALMHEKFVNDFDEKERLLIGKIKEVEIKLSNKQPVVKKNPPKTPKK